MATEGNAKRKEDVLDEIAAANREAARASLAELVALLTCLLNDTE